MMIPGWSRSAEASGALPLALTDDRSPSSPTSRSVIGDAVRTTRHSIMLSTNCLGPCAQATVVALGAATMKNRAWAWLPPPTYWRATETAQRAAELGGCIKASAITVDANLADRIRQS